MRSTISTVLSRVWPGLAPRKQAGGIPVSFHHLRYEVIDERAWVGWTAVVEKEWETRLCLLRKEWVNVAAFVEKGVGRIETTGGLVEGITS